ncbi:hypothetical protein AYI70_g3087 [Smittium culicis]|uniref:Uncharacterized protein n=1 Tax=Smittium culicis TaxID=133412 RepID=A0A1R1Y5Q7_9FUNG|nr:hypothetical protein AYI70_g3087 [Smittium culicis]
MPPVQTSVNSLSTIAVSDTPNDEISDFILLNDTEFGLSAISALDSGYLSKSHFNPIKPTFSKALHSNVYSFIAGLGDGSLVGLFNYEIEPLDEDDNIDENQELSNSDICSNLDSSTNNGSNWKPTKWVGVHNYIVSGIDNCGFSLDKISTCSLDGHIKMFSSEHVVYTSVESDDTSISSETCVIDGDSLVPLLDLDVSSIVSKPDFVKSSNNGSRILYTSGCLPLATNQQSSLKLGNIYGFSIKN